MSRARAGETLRFETTVTNNGTLTDAPNITFRWKIGKYGEEKSVPPSRSSLGVYYVDVTPDQSGNLYARWDTDGALDVVSEPVINVAPTAFEAY